MSATSAYPVTRHCVKRVDVLQNTEPTEPSIEVGLLTGGFDKPYALGLVRTLAAQGVCLDVIGSDEVDSPELHSNTGLTFLNLRGKQLGSAGLARKALRVLIYYARLIRYAAIARPKIFHILWNNKFQLFDRTLLMLYYKLQGKELALTAHNVNAGKRDGNDSFINRFTLKIQYKLADHIFVHTEKMKSELCQEFGIREQAITVIPFGINNTVPDTDLTPAQARRRLGIQGNEKTILFFGSIRPYKGLVGLVAAFQQILSKNADYRLIIAGEPKRGSEEYLDDIQKTISRNIPDGRVLQRIGYIPDEETELYFKAADVLVLPYTHVFQSGVLFLAYSFGLPIIATDVGSLRDELIEGRTGFICRPCDSEDLARTIEMYFDSDLFKGLDARRQEIRDYANERHSWEIVGDLTRNVYMQLLGQKL